MIHLTLSIVYDQIIHFLMILSLGIIVISGGKYNLLSAAERVVDMCDEHT
jgi:hypothetical protein